MEHIVQFAIGIDDESIRKRIEDSAEKQIIETLVKDVKTTIFEKDSWRKEGYREGVASYYLDKKIDDLLESCREDIIELAAEKLAARLCKTKKAKERLDTILAAIEEE